MVLNSDVVGDKGVKAAAWLLCSAVLLHRSSVPATKKSAPAPRRRTDLHRRFWPCSMQRSVHLRRPPCVRRSYKGGDPPNSHSSVTEAH
ncbi:hypothetical protein CC80DRAFT_233863 [Byssothecium circinans]|uniref:Uncharacterized protein n=1 Tax=Byssothecium circinans TaxID=147558 RepID=A0A6A5UBC1_9PLEO|nr:hypothetical protein CC80DRAFT_233863 [Byssothecium circinans]